MENFLLMIMMTIIGAAIGGVTNSLAIKMLFRPYQPVMVGRWKLPFTPGLIPKRRAELAKQLGRMVVDYLLTAEGLKKKMGEEVFREQISAWAQKETTAVFDKQEKIHILLEKAGFHIEEERIKRFVAGWSVKIYNEWVDKNKDKEIRQFIKGRWQDRTIQAGTELTDYLHRQLAVYIGSAEAKQAIKLMVAGYVEKKGFFANMVSSLMGEEELAGKIQSVLNEYINSLETNRQLKEMVGRELAGFLNLTIKDIEEKIGKGTVTEELEAWIDHHVQVDVWMDRSLNDWAGSLRPFILNEMIPGAAEALSLIFADKVDVLMKQLHLADIVEREVAAFPINRLEQLVLDISRKELKMITYLGVLLGGLIGLFQGFIVLFIN